jgi:hypothetical protein
MVRNQDALFVVWAHRSRITLISSRQYHCRSWLAADKMTAGFGAAHAFGPPLITHRHSIAAVQAYRRPDLYPDDTIQLIFNYP